MFEHQLFVIGALLFIVLIILASGLDDVLGGILLPIVIAISVFLGVDFIVRSFINISIICIIVNSIVTLWFWLKWPAIKKHLRDQVHADDLNSQ